MLIDLGDLKIPVGDLIVTEASVRPRSVLALVTLKEMEEGTIHKLRLDLGKSVFIDHVDLHSGDKVKIRIPTHQVRELTKTIVKALRSEKYAEEYNKPPKKVCVTKASPT